MLFHVKMTVVPPEKPDDAFEALKAEEKAYAQGLQAEGIWRHLWRVAGQYQNVSIFDVRDAEHLHQILMNLPLLPHLEFEITALCRHPSTIHADDR